VVGLKSYQTGGNRKGRIKLKIISETVEGRGGAGHSECVKKKKKKKKKKRLSQRGVRKKGFKRITVFS